MIDRKPSYITVMSSMGGWKALLLTWNPDHGGFYEPYQTGLGAYATREEAVSEAKWWAENEGLEFKS